MKKKYVVEFIKRELFLVPIEAESEEKAEELANAAMDKMNEKTFYQEFGFDKDWESQVFLYDKHGSSFPSESFVSDISLK